MKERKGKELTIISSRRMTQLKSESVDREKIGKIRATIKTKSTRFVRANGAPILKKKSQLGQEQAERGSLESCLQYSDGTRV